MFTVLPDNAEQTIGLISMSTINTINPSELKDWLNKGEAVLVDVREPDEFTQWRIPHAISMPLTGIDKHLPHLEGETRKVVFQCLKGTRGEMAAKAAKENFANSLDIYNLTGGIEAWENAGQTTLKHAKSASIPLMRQVLIAAGSLVLLFSILALAGIKAGTFLAAFVGAGLMFAGITGVCAMAAVLEKMPWNK